jgi:flavin reductase
MPVEPDAFRLALGRFATGVTVLTTCAEDAVHGMTANAFTSLSLRPPLVLVCVDLEAAMHPLMEGSGIFAVSILREDQQAVSDWFASAERPPGSAQFADVDWSPGSVTGCPLLTGAVAHLECRVVAVHPGGDHSIFVGEVVGADAVQDARPLLYYAAGYRSLE